MFVDEKDKTDILYCFTILDLIFSTRLFKSKSEIKRLIMQKAVKIDNITARSYDQVLKKGEHIFKIGKRCFFKMHIPSIFFKKITEYEIIENEKCAQISYLPLLEEDNFEFQFINNTE